MQPRPERVVKGKRPPSSGLIRELELKRRRHRIRRVIQVVALVVVIALTALIVRFVVHRRAEGEALALAWTYYREGTLADLTLAAQILEEAGATRGSAGTAALALLRAHAVLEYGEHQAEAEAIVEEADDRPAAHLASGMLDYAAGDRTSATAAMHAEIASASPLMRAEAVWLRAALALGTPEDSEGLREALTAVEAFIAREPTSVVHRRIRIYLLMAAGKTKDAFDALEVLREDSPEHMGLAADEAFFNALEHREYGGVASVADQILAADRELVSRQSRSLAALARAVVLVRRGQTAEGVAMLRNAWPALPRWLPMAQSLALQTALEAGAVDEAEGWLATARLDDTLRETFAAWILSSRGDFRRALDALAKLPQEDRYVGYLQALALVEQGRYEEAEPWLERVRKLWPGQVDIEVAHARMALRRHDAEVARRKLQALAEQEPYAPRAWTGLAEAYLLSGREEDLALAEAALDKAIAVEPMPAEALLHLAAVRKRQRATNPNADLEALGYFERAVELNPHWPRYREARALHLLHLGRRAEARAALQKLADVPGVTWNVPLQLAMLTSSGETEAAQLSAQDLEQLQTHLAKARELGAPEADLMAARARVALRSRDADELAKISTELSAALERKPAAVPVRVAYALVELARGNGDGAELIIRKGFRVVPEHEHGRLYYAWGKIDLARHRVSLAASRLRSAWLKMVDEGRPAAELLDVAELAISVWQQRLDNQRVALAIARQLTNAIGHHGQAWTIRARTELAAAETTAALESANKAIARDANDAEAHLLLGHAKMRMADRAAARQAYARAVELAEGTAQEQSYRQYLERAKG